MDRRIALLLNVNYADFYACVCAVELAKRNAGRIYALLPSGEAVESMATQVNWGASRQEKYGTRQDVLRMAAMLAAHEAITFDCHLLDTGRAETIHEFLCIHHISSMVIGAADPNALQGKMHWLMECGRKLYADDRWGMKSFAGLVAGPWDDNTFERVLLSLRLDSRTAPDLAQRIIATMDVGGRRHQQQIEKKLKREE